MHECLFLMHSNSQSHPSPNLSPKGRGIVYKSGSARRALPLKKITHPFKGRIKVGMGLMRA